MRPIRQSGPAASFEELEGRRLLSGNVTVTDDGSTIKITGDNGPTRIEINGDGGFAYVVNGLNGTKVNGAASQSFPVTTTHNLNVKLGDGPDAITLDQGVAFVNASIKVGNGPDTVTLRDAGTFGDMSIVTGNGPDTVNLDGIDVGGNLTVLTGNGPDHVNLGAGDFIPADFVGGNTVLNAGGGPDALTGLASLNTLGTQTIVGFESIS